jgi:hypothetical protein
MKIIKNNRFAAPARILNLVIIAIALSMSFTSCKDDDDEPVPTPAPNNNSGKPVVELIGSAAIDKTLDADTIYLIKGYYYVTSPAILTIEEGTVIKGDKPTKGALIITRGAKIMANGTAAKPIVFTSNEPAGSRSYGDWAGIIVCGRAPVNQGTDVAYEGGAVPGATFGGNDAADNSGIIRYVRIEYAGIAINTNQEINGLTLGGVGSGTVVENVQVSYSGDDSFEMFGGTVNLRNIIAFRGWDDDFDTDFGYSGNIQYAVALRDPNNADQSGSNGFETDNDPSGTTATPLTSARFSNVSIFGPMVTGSTVINTNYKRGAHIRRNSSQSLYNSVIAGYPTAGLFLDGALVEANALSNALQFRNNVIAGCPTPFTITGGTGALDLTTWFNSNNNFIYTDNASLGVNDPFNLSSPNFLPNGTSPLLAGADFTGLNGFDVVTFRGAFGSTDWTAGWANYDPQNTNY